MTMDEVGGAVDRHRARALGGVRADRLHPGHLGPVLPAVRADDRGRDHHLGLQLADPVAGALRAAPEAASAEHHRPRFFLARSAARLANGFNRGFDATSHGYSRAVRVLVGRKVAARRHAARSMRGVIAGTRLPRPHHADRLHPGAGPGLPDRRHPAARRRLADRTDAVMQRAEEIIKDDPGHRATSSRSRASTARPSPTRTSGGVMFLPLKPFEERTTPQLAAARARRARSSASSPSIQEAVIFALPPPPVQGLGNAGGFKMQLQDRTGAGLGAAARGGARPDRRRRTRTRT